MATREEIVSSVDNVAALHQRYEQACDEGAQASQRHWSALRADQGRHEAAGVVAARAQVADADAASVTAFEEFATALVDIRALELSTAAQARAVSAGSPDERQDTSE